MPEPVERKVQRDRTTERRIQCRLQPGGRMTLREFLNMVAQFHPEGWGRADDTFVHFNSLVWDDDPTEEELAKWAGWDAEHEERTEKWERWKLGELIEKYGVPVAAHPEVESKPRSLLDARSVDEALAMYRAESRSPEVEK